MRKRNRTQDKNYPPMLEEGSLRPYNLETISVQQTWLSLVSPEEAFQESNFPSSLHYMMTASCSGHDLEIKSLSILGDA